MSEDNIKRALLCTLCVVLTLMSLHLSSGWCGLGAVLAFITAVD